MRIVNNPKSFSCASRTETDGYIFETVLEFLKGVRIDNSLRAV